MDPSLRPTGLLSGNQGASLPRAPRQREWQSCLNASTAGTTQRLGKHQVVPRPYAKFSRKQTSLQRTCATPDPVPHLQTLVADLPECTPSNFSRSSQLPSAAAVCPRAESPS